MKLAPTILLMLALLALGGCGAPSAMPPVRPTPEGPTADVSGTVTNRRGETLCEVLVEVNGESTMTNADGIFVLKQVPFDEAPLALRASKAGYFDAVRGIRLTGDSISLSIQLQDRTWIGTVDAASGGEASTVEGLEVRLPPNAIAGGYEGEVRIYADYLDPTSEDDLFELPGLDAVNAAGESGILESFGMGTIELEDAAGNPLQLAQGVTAELTFPLNAQQFAAAENTIALWYLDEETGIWREEGSASLVGDTYIGEVSHFSTWNADKFACGVFAHVRVRCDGEPLRSTTLVLRVPSRPFLPESVAYTGRSGVFAAALPCEDEVDVYMLITGASRICRWKLGTILISEADVGDDGIAILDLEADCPPFAQVEGVLTDCSDEPVTNGYVYGRIGDFRSPIALTEADGSFSLRVWDCTDAAAETTLVAWDLDTLTTVSGPTVPLNDQETFLAEPWPVCGAAAPINGRLYVSGSDMACMDAATGEVLWDIRTSGGFGIPVVEDGRVFLGEGGVISPRLRALNAADGSVLWEWGAAPAGPVRDGVMYTARGETLYQLDVTDGSVDWARTIGVPMTSFALLDDTIYCGGVERVVSVDTEAGDLNWSHITTDGGRRPCVADGRVFFAERGLVALDATDGGFLWEQANGSDGVCLTHAPTVHEGAAYMTCDDRLWASDVETGEVLWTFVEEDETFNLELTSPFYEEGRIYVGVNWREIDEVTRVVGDFKGAVRCFDAATGELLFSRDLGTIGNLVVVDGVLFTPVSIHLGSIDYDERVFALDAVTGATIWSRAFDGLPQHVTAVDDAGVTHYPSASGMRQ